jgi:hypothetical protein
MSSTTTTSTGGGGGAAEAGRTTSVVQHYYHHQHHHVTGPRHLLMVLFFGFGFCSTMMLLQSPPSSSAGRPCCDGVGVHVEYAPAKTIDSRDQHDDVVSDAGTRNSSLKIIMDATDGKDLVQQQADVDELSDEF